MTRFQQMNKKELLPMSNLSGGNMIVGLDIGTSKVVAIVGEINEEGGLNIVGIGRHSPVVLRKGPWSILNPLCSQSSVQWKRPS